MRILPPDDKDKLFDLLLEYYKLNETTMNTDFLTEEGEAMSFIIFEELQGVTDKINIILGLKKREIIQTELKFE